MKYAWARDGLFKDLDPQVAGEHLESLVEHFNEHLTADEILADARKRTSPLHSAFEWDENAAAEKWRLRQARGMITALVPVKNGKKQKTRAFVFVRHGKYERKVFMPVRSAMGRPDMRDQLVENAYRSLTLWVNHYGGRQELRLVQRDVERLKKRIQADLMGMV